MTNTNDTTISPRSGINNQRIALASAVALTLCSGLSHAQAESESRNILSGSDAVKLSISGQINRAAMLVEDGEDTTLLNVDNNASSSRVRFIAESTASGPWSAGAALETEFRLNNSFTISQLDENQDDASAFRNRRVEVYFANEDLGKIWLGQGWTASEGVSENDLSGTAIAGYSEVNTTSGGILFREKGFDGELSPRGPNNPDLRSVATNLDGLGRNTRIRYDTPKFNGFQLRTSAVNQGGVDVALFYSGNVDRLKIAAGMAWANSDEATGNDGAAALDDQVSGSISVLDTSGFSATVALGQASKNDSSLEDVTFAYTKLGYQTKLIDAGTTHFSVDYHTTDDLQREDDTVEVIGFQALQKVSSIGTDFYASLRSISLDRTGVDYEDNLVALLGARVTF
ncbi:MAG: hypothetical protein WD623_02335 [Marinobacter sp.]|uniref:porin n=1 Tax=Marinobacter sp. TaxID=50741 RepID=UPI00349FEF9E